MALTHAQIVTQVEEDTGRTDKTTQIGSYVNRSQIIMVNDASQMNHEFSCLKKEKTAETVDGTKTYTFPTNMKSLYDLRINETSDKAKMRPLNAMTQDAHLPWPESDAEGAPVNYIPWGKYFELSPIPDAAYTMMIRYLIWPAEMATGAESDLLYMDEVIIKCADWLTVLSLNIEADIRRFRSEYEKLLTSAVRSDRQRHKYDTKIRIQPFVAGHTQLPAPGYWNKPAFLENPR